MHAPARYSWKQHWAQEKFSSPDLLSCTQEEREQYTKRLKECTVTLTANVKTTNGQPVTLDTIIDILTDPSKKKIQKINRNVVFGTSNGVRPTGDTAYELWNGWQVIDLDIKDAEMAKKLKAKIFKALHKCNWFLGVTYSSSGMGLHVYTKIAIPEEINVPMSAGINISVGFSVSRMERMIRSVSVAVFPEPADALTSRVLSRRSMASCCSS